MPLSKLQFNPGVNKEGTRYSAEGNWFATEKVRFRQGLPEKIGGWARISGNTFLGVARSLHVWGDLNSTVHTGVGTHLKIYVEKGGTYYDITPLRKAAINFDGTADPDTNANPIITFADSTTVRVVDIRGGYIDGDFVTFGGSLTTTNGVETADLQNKEFQISYDSSLQATAKIDNGGGYSAVKDDIVLSNVSDTLQIGMTITGTNINAGTYITHIDSQGSGAARIDLSENVGTIAHEADVNFTFAHSYTITIASAAGNSPATSPAGGSSLTAEYQINTGTSVPTVFSGWGAGFWGESTWGNGGNSTVDLRLWSQANFGEDLLFGARGGELFFWDNSGGVTSRAVKVSSLAGASQTPTQQNIVLVSDISRIVLCFGTNDVFTTTVDPMLVRWSDQESVVEWSPAATNQAGSLRLSRGSEIVAAIQGRQEILVWTDAALYTMQYVGPPDVWTAQLVGENISIASQNSASYANGMTFWMGKDKFYVYDGNLKPLPCTVKRHVFSNLNASQYRQVTSGTNEGFHEIWWFYPSADSTTNDLYVIYNYLENIWYHGTMARTAWVDSGVRQVPLAATYSNNLVEHETGINDGEGATTSAITASIESSQFDLDDGDRMSFVWRILPDITFENSTAGTPSVTMSLLPAKSSGSDLNNPLSEGGDSSASVTRLPTASFTVEAYTTQINTRVRGRQLGFKIESTDLDVQWQLGYPRIDMRPDGRR